MAHGTSNILIQALWSTVKAVTGTFGLQPIWILYAIGGLFVFGTIQQIYGAIKNRQSFTLDQQDGSYFYRDDGDDE